MGVAKPFRLLDSSARCIQVAMAVNGTVAGHGSFLIGTALVFLGACLTLNTALGQSLTRERLPQAPSVRIAPGSNLGLIQSFADDDLPRSIEPAVGAQALPAIERLRDAANAAVARSATVREVAAAVRASLQDVNEAQAARYPQVSVEVTSRYSQAPANSFAQSLRGAPYYVATATLPVYDFGRISGQVGSRVASSDAQSERLRSAYETVASETLTALIELARSRALVAATDRYLARMDQLSRMISELVREDRGRSSELTQVQSRLLQAGSARSALESRLRETEITIAKLIGDNAEAMALVGAASSTAMIRLFMAPPPLEPLLFGIDRHPLIRQLMAEAEAQSQTASALSSARMPQFNAVAGRTPINPGASTQYLDFAGVTMSLSLYRGGGDVAAERSARERELSVRERRDQAERDLTARVRLSYQNATSQLIRAEEYVQLLKVSDRIRRDFYEQWGQLGRRSLFELLAAEGDHHSMRLAWINSIHDSATAQIRMRSEAGALSDWLGSSE